jgi:RND superfamily putative drug exporter
MLAAVARLPHVSAVVSPYVARGGSPSISPSGRIAFAYATFNAPESQLRHRAEQTFVATARAGSGDGVEVEVEGQVARAAAGTGTGSVALGAFAAGVVLFLVFGSLLATMLPLITTALALGVGTAIDGLLSHLMQMASFSSELSLLIGLGVGVDYALFILTRYRQGLLHGLSSRAALLDALDTSGRAVLFAGITVCLAMLGMLALGVGFLYGVALATSMAVAFTVIAALTLLPALIGFFGVRVLPRRERRAVRAGDARAGDGSRAWIRWADFLRRRPAGLATAAAALMLLIAVPFLSMRLGYADSGSDPPGSTTHKAYELLVEGFGPGYTGPLQLVASIASPAQRAAFVRAERAVARTPGVAHATLARMPGVAHAGLARMPGAAHAGLARVPGVAHTPLARMPGLADAARPGVVDGGVAIADVYPTTAPQAAATADLLRRIRDQVLPAATRGTGPTVLVGGQTAIFADLNRALSRDLPLFFAVIVLASFLLLAAVFRSLLIPVIGAAMNLLSTAAAFGIVTAIFQDGVGISLLGVPQAGPIEPYVPVMMFAILFGLSMDYEVFLVARIFEEWHRRRDNQQAVFHGLAATGRTITAAAAIMVLVFAAFVFGAERMIKLFGVGLAAAVLLDAVIVRSVLVPGLMLILGERNWRLPAVLERILPRLDVDRAGAAAATVSAAVENPLPEPAAVENPLPEPAGVENPLPEPAAVENPLPEPAAVENPLPEPAAS